MDLCSSLLQKLFRLLAHSGHCKEHHSVDTTVPSSKRTGRGGQEPAEKGLIKSEDLMHKKIMKCPEKNTQLREGWAPGGKGRLIKASRDDDLNRWRPGKQGTHTRMAMRTQELRQRTCVGKLGDGTGKAGQGPVTCITRQGVGI